MKITTVQQKPDPSPSLVGPFTPVCHVSDRVRVGCMGSMVEDERGDATLATGGFATKGICLLGTFHALAQTLAHRLLSPLFYLHRFSNLQYLFSSLSLALSISNCNGTPFEAHHILNLRAPCDSIRPPNVSGKRPASSFSQNGNSNSRNGEAPIPVCPNSSLAAGGSGVQPVWGKITKRSVDAPRRSALTPLRTRQCTSLASTMAMEALSSDSSCMIASQHGCFKSGASTISVIYPFQ
ncbi:hypothetical protein CK203_100593 [Vitis vinifera]|uniref:Uncharacterized protein n=1 Tax=Vitis vinifera TaxID=29760 RepID=A0A438CZ73_VITVI|nr:hypothetical protein CK203_100593 [Vitis vinifera]